MIPPDAPAEKRAALRRHHALNPRPQRVRDPAFLGENAFFDRSDLVQVKYEMLRRVREDGQPVSEASAAFGFSRPSFYQAQAAFQEEGLPGLLPERPGPKRAHKLSETVLDLLEEALAEEPSLPSAALVRLLEERLGLSVHPRSVERALKRRRKKGAPGTP
ncbi:MAG: helix-turn-helix domain-containing protein [Thermoleophilia bacterium]|nr:helix-turn-helix domain-containing protein [Thermoleophilia bacterium]MCZ7664921.1 helix-turn-helix domain-containing protein [Thermoleophilia bacterium]MCZ7665385.1 helix-turn-helix domain-containing protein [Thermoleophilia bacterium]